MPAPAAFGRACGLVSLPGEGAGDPGRDGSGEDPSGGDQRRGEPVLPADRVEGAFLVETDEGNEQVKCVEERAELRCLAERDRMVGGERGRSDGEECDEP